MEERLRETTPAWDGSDPLPGDPLAVAARWLEDAFAAGLQSEPHAVALATQEPGGGPAVRMVLCQAIDAVAGTLAFYTHRESAKGRDLAARPRAALCFFFGPQRRQVRVAGPVTLASDAASDAYFAPRPREAQLGAWASRQSEPVASRAELRRRVGEVEKRFAGTAVPRPAGWGGYLVWAETVELWISGGPARLHDRGRWTRDLSDPARPGGWLGERLQP
jgi:pyridoxamine 5'-phosphate oxidase